MRVGLVLGAGGIQGGAWLTGGLDALAEETGWDPAEADYVVGTSAGSMMGALCASGVPPWFMVAHSRGEVFEGVVGADGRPAAEADRAGGARFELQRALPPIGPGSWRLALRTLANPRRYTPATVFTGWIPRGIFSTESLKETIRRVVPSGWSPHPNLWVVACDYETGRRVPFGRAGAPEADLADAVAASCAHPRHLPPADDRRAPLRRRRHLLDLEPRPTARRGARPRDLSQPHLHPAPGPGGVQPARVVQHRDAKRLRPAARERGQEAPRPRHRRRPDPAHRRGPRGDGPEPDEHASGEIT